MLAISGFKSCMFSGKNAMKLEINNKIHVWKLRNIGVNKYSSKKVSE